MKKLLMSLLFFFLIVSNSFAVVELDGDSNGATDISKGGTNSTSASGARQNLEIDSPNKSFIIFEAVATDDFLLWLTPVAITITDIKGVLQSGTGTVVGRLYEVDSDGVSNPSAVDTSDITFNGGLDEDDGSLNDPNIAANHWVRWVTASITLSPGFLTVMIYYTID